VAASLAALAFGAVALFLTARSLPARLLREIKMATAATHRQGEDLAQLQASWIAYQAAVENVLEQLEVVEERTRRHAATVKQRETRERKRAEQVEAQAPADPVMELTSRARAMGIPV